MKFDRTKSIMQQIQEKLAEERKGTRNTPCVQITLYGDGSASIRKFTDGEYNKGNKIEKNTWCGPANKASERITDALDCVFSNNEPKPVVKSSIIF